MKRTLKKNLKSISGWGKNKFVRVEIVKPKTINEIKHIIINSKPESIIARGKGKSYGDAAQIKDGKVLKLNNFKRIFPNFENKEVTAQAGATLEEILEIIIPKGFFLPVTPGTKKITLGGAIAADVHGKNHYQDGSFGNHIKEIKIINGIGKEIILSPNKKNSSETNKQFWATVGGMGLTGIILEATFSIIPIETSFIQEKTTRYNNLEDLIKDMIKNENKYKYSVAWIDSMNRNLRGVVNYGNHIKANRIKKESKLSFNPKAIISIPNIILINLMNRLLIKIINEFLFLKSPKASTLRIKTINNFFYPLDAIEQWNNVYGKNGFIQYQIVIPEEHTLIIRKILDELKKVKASSFLPVLKRFGPANESYLSFPLSGWTLSIDLPAHNNRIENVLQKLDKEIADIGGKIYLAKDSRQSSYIFKKTYKSIEDWKEQKQILDPRNIFTSDIAMRLKLTN